MPHLPRRHRRVDAHDPSRRRRTTARRSTSCAPRGRDAAPVALIGQAGVLGPRPGEGLKVAAAASAIRARVGGEFPPLTARLERVRATGEAALGGDAERVWAEGARLGLDDAVALAFGTATPPASPTGLSARELEVAELVAAGLSNKAIAAASTLRANRREPRAPRTRQGRVDNPPSSRPGRASAFSSDSAVALMTVGPSPPSTPPPWPRAGGGDAREGGGWRSA